MLLLLPKTLLVASNIDRGESINSIAEPLVVWAQKSIMLLLVVRIVLFCFCVVWHNTTVVRS